METASRYIGTPVHSGKVLPEWIDYNGHMNVAYYLLAFDLGVDALWIDFGITEKHVSENQSSTFAVESHVLYKQELKLDDPYVITAQILAYDEKRIHQFQRMYHERDGYLAATAEWLSLHIDLRARKVAPWPPQIFAGIGKVAAGQSDWGVPKEQGSTISIKQPVWTAGQ